MKRGATGFRPSEEHETSDLWVGYAHAPTSIKQPGWAVVVSDECQVEDVLYGRPAQAGATELQPGGRLLLAPVRAASDEEVALESYKRITMTPDGTLASLAGGGKGVLIDFDQAFNVKLMSAEVGDFIASRIGAPATNQDRDHVLRRWSAYAVRRGPVVAQTTAVQLAQLVGDSAATEPAEKVFTLLSSLWAIEGQLSDAVSEATEKVRLSDAPEAAKAEQAERIRNAFLRACEVIGAASADAAAEISAM
jgi:hypothetical protein